MGAAAFLDEMIGPIDHIMPGAPVPMVVAGEIEHTGTLNIESHIEVISELEKEMTGIGGFIAATTIIGAAHVRADTQPLLRPAVPHPVSVQTHRNCGFLRLGLSKKIAHDPF